MYRAVLYISEASFADTSSQESQILEIEKNSVQANEKHNISGVLAYNKGRFLHVLEGDTDTLSTLLDNIKKDSRNKNLSIVLDIEVKEKIYSDWQMIISKSEEQSERLGYFLRRSIDELPLIEQDQHETLEDFINEIFN